MINANPRPDLAFLRPFVTPSQAAAIASGLYSEEREFFKDKLRELRNLIEKMPRTYETEGQGGNAIAHLHYFVGGKANWYITELDKGAPGDTPDMWMSQCYGKADLFGDGGELGYISIPELLSVGAELDLYWTPTQLDQIES